MACLSLAERGGLEKSRIIQKNPSGFYRKGFNTCTTLCYTGIELFHIYETVNIISTKVREIKC